MQRTVLAQLLSPSLFLRILKMDIAKVYKEGKHSESQKRDKLKLWNYKTNFSNFLKLNNKYRSREKFSVSYIDRTKFNKNWHLLKKDN